MKKHIAVILAFMLVLLMSSCGGSSYGAYAGVYNNDILGENACIILDNKGALGIKFSCLGLDDADLDEYGLDKDGGVKIGTYKVGDKGALYFEYDINDLDETNQVSFAIGLSSSMIAGILGESVEYDSKAKCFTTSSFDGVVFMKSETKAPALLTNEEFIKKVSDTLEEQSTELSKEEQSKQDGQKTEQPNQGTKNNAPTNVSIAELLLSKYTDIKNVFNVIEDDMGNFAIADAPYKSVSFWFDGDSDYPAGATWNKDAVDKNLLILPDCTVDSGIEGILKSDYISNPGVTPEDVSDMQACDFNVSNDIVLSASFWEGQVASYTMYK